MYVDAAEAQQKKGGECTGKGVGGSGYVDMFTLALNLRIEVIKGRKEISDKRVLMETLRQARISSRMEVLKGAI